MTHPIYIKRSVKEKLPETEVLAFNKTDDMLLGYLSRINDGSITCENENELMYSVTHWLEEVPLEEYLKEINYKHK